MHTTGTGKRAIDAPLTRPNARSTGKSHEIIRNQPETYLEILSSATIVKNGQKWSKIAIWNLEYLAP